MKTILLCGYRSSDTMDTTLGLERGVDGRHRLDNQIQKLTRLGHEVVCVLSGASAEDQLRHCPDIANTELVYDTSDHPHLASNLRAGLQATEGQSCFVLPVEIPTPDSAVWYELSEELRKMGFHTPVSLLQAVTAEGAPWHFGFPLLITRSGNALIRELANFCSLTDSRLTFHHVLAASTKAL